MAVFFTSDLHLNHVRILDYCDRPYGSIEQMNKGLIANINAMVGRDDELFILGDFTCHAKRGHGMAFREQINCKNVSLVYGNHDKDYKACHCFQETEHYLSRTFDGERIVMMHYPIASWNWKKYGIIHLHGHIHSDGEYNKRNIENGVIRFDVGMDANNCLPVPLKTVLEWANAARKHFVKEEKRTIVDL